MNPVPCDCCGATNWQPLFSENGITLGECGKCDLLYIKEMPALDRRMTEIEEGHYAGTQEMLSATRQLAAERILEARFQTFVSLGRSTSAVAAGSTSAAGPACCCSSPSVRASSPRAWS